MSIVSVLNCIEKIKAAIIIWCNFYLAISKTGLGYQIGQLYPAFGLTGYPAKV